MDEDIAFFMGPRYHLQRHDIDFPEITPIKECDMVKSIEVRCLAPDMNSLLTDPANAIIHAMTSSAMKCWEFFSRQVELRKIAAIPDIIFIVTKADARFILSTGVSTLEFSGTRTVMNKVAEKFLSTLINYM
ncbi:hypothetical protein BOTNAR_0206g00180 [Botryotinia narcissicola]|uniref:Uncharacterized protein n=1 Tax=Botryotinia narcissicola TaxID=278944 RepID=A0A4Z1ICG7_9HELO|nr:hypothetical protein BOTNAR_0206g00180 [Botryotinia narcissicola]